MLIPICDSIKDYLLPRSLTIRLAKSVLPPNTVIQKDAVLAIQKAATVFVSYLSSQCVPLPSAKNNTKITFRDEERVY